MSTAAELQREYSRRSHAKHREKRNTYSREYAARDPEGVKRRNAEYYAKNRERERARAAAYRAANPERSAAQEAKRWAERRAEERARGKAYRASNPEKIRQLAARRRAHKAQAVPAWANPAAIAEVYAKAHAGSTAENPLHVDHLVPLRSKLVCGLHVENNLAVMPAVVNLYKGCSVWPGGPQSRSEYRATIRQLKTEGFL